MERLKKLLDTSNTDNATYKPQFFRLANSKDAEALEVLLASNDKLVKHDALEGQLRELVKGRHPSVKIKQDEYPGLLQQHLAGRDMTSYGVWVYYPWSSRLVHMLDEAEFVEVRTNRNQYKITPEEQQLLATKKIGVIGLSVGQSIALSLAMERLFGELRLADFDVLELSNMNRIRTGVYNLDVPKVIVAAREIVEIDPFLNVRIFPEGITAANIDDFFTGNGKLDLLVEVCDGLDIKVQSRYKARELQIPVLMDTSDRGMIDVERFDLEPGRPILHGLAGDLDPAKMTGLTNEEKIPYIMQMIGAETISARLKASMLEVESTITTWPQLASSVILGGAASADVARRILLDQFRDSGRYYVDVETIIPSTPRQKLTTPHINPYQPLTCEQMEEKAAAFDNKALNGEKLTTDQLEALAKAAVSAPSAGNNQPWKWLSKDNCLFLFHDKHRSYSWGDFDEIGSHEGLGAAIEAVNLEAIKQGLQAEVQLYPDKNDPVFTAVIWFRRLEGAVAPLLMPLAENMHKRHTNRKLGQRVVLPDDFYKSFAQVVESIPGAAVQIIKDEDQLRRLGEVISACDRVRLLYQQGHEEFFHEIRWTPYDAQETGDGIDISLVDITESEKAGFKIAVDWNAISLLQEWDKGRAFQKMSRKGVAAASAMALITMPAFDKENFVQAGRAVFRGWVYANSQDVAVHPMLSPVFFFNMLKYGKETDMTPVMRRELTHVRKEYESIFNLGGAEELFLIKLAIAPSESGKTYRLPLEKVFYIKE